MSKTLNFSDSFFKSRIANHIAFWLISVIILSYYSSLFGGSLKENFIQMCVLLPLQMAAAYLLSYVQIPTWLFKRNWLIFVFSFIAIAYFFSVLARLSTIYIVEPLINYQGYDESISEVLSDPIYLMKVYMPLVYMPAFLFLIFKMLKERFTQENLLIQLEKEKSNAELNFLKAQMNPHFLFNTLNNIYSLSKNNSEQTPEMILKLSELLDYTIYECNEKTVPIIKEWQLIENYVDLQAVRQSNQLILTIHQDIDNEEIKIAPLILISLVENAFKHSSTSQQNTVTIKILLKVVQGILTFEVFNSKSENQKNIEQKKGIGIANVKKQLALLYPNKYNITIDNQPDFYKVILTINL